MANNQTPERSVLNQSVQSIDSDTNEFHGFPPVQPTASALQPPNRGPSPILPPTTLDAIEQQLDRLIQDEAMYNVHNRTDYYVLDNHLTDLITLKRSYFMGIERQTDRGIPLDIDLSHRIRSKFGLLNGKLRSSMHEFETRESVQNMADASARIAQQRPSHVVSARLPDIPLPKFDGNFKLWLNFKSTFTSLVINNPGIDDTLRYHYLRQVLSGEALNRISNSPSGNFQVAWDLLSQRYDNSMLIAETHLSAILNPPKLDWKSSQSWRTFIDNQKTNISALENLALDISVKDLMFLYITVSHFDNATLRDWERFSSTKTILSMDCLWEFLEQQHKISQALAQNSLAQSFLCHGATNPLIQPSSSKQAVQPKSNANNFNPPKTPNVFNRSPTLQCHFCQNGTHNVFSCNALNKIPLPERAGVVLQKNLCINCIKPWDRSHQCQGACKTCQHRHHTVLHGSNFSKRSNLVVASNYARNPPQHLPRSGRRMPHREYRSPFQNQQNDSHADHQSRLQSTLPFPGHSNSSTQQCSTHSSQFAPSTQPLQSPVQSLPTSNSVDNSALSGCRSDQYSQCGSNQSNSQFVPSQPLELTQSPQPAMPSSEPHSQAVSYAHSAPHIESVNSRRACIMPTAQLVVFDKNGQPVTCRALLDSGSDSCFISRQLASRLQLPSVCTGGTVHTVSGSNATLLNLSSLNIHSPDHTWSTRIDCIVTEKITPSMPPPGLNLSDFDIPPNIILADSSFFEISGVDILLNVDVYAMLHLPGQIRLSESCVLQNTRLGWVTWGSIPVLKPTINQCISNFVSNLDHSNEHVTNADISKQLEKFWRMEEIDVKTSTPTEHAQIEQHYIDNVRRMDDGRFSVALPKKETFHSLGQSYKQALTRFHSLEKRLAANAELKKQYTEFMEEYINLGHMSPAPESSYQEFCYHIPHHPVFKPDSTTTKLRVVFDASAKSVTGLSLNDVIHIGPTVQPELFETVLRFRTHRIAFIADVTKMYRQILVHPEDRNVQRIFWRSDENQPVQEYFLNTVTYGTSSAPYLATRTLNHLADVECPPNSAVCHALKEDFYVDDLISGSSTIESAIELSHQLLTTVDRGKMELRKWLSNSTELLATIPPHLVETATSRPLSDSSDSVVKALGLIWNSTTDQLIISSSITDVALKTSFTKRELLSSISSIFDPLGLISPVVILPKLLFQKLWLHKLDWDDKLPPELLTEWLSILKELPNISNIAIPRCVLPPSTDVKLELHAFSDASATAYGACLYIRSISSNGVQVKLLTSKSKVASIKPLLTIPRLELQAAHLSAKLVVKAIQASKLKFSNVVLWTDSKIVCDWLKALPNRADVFVSVRVSTIQNLTADFTWKHVRTKHNPADLVSRGCTPATLINSSLWWNGPSWLSEPEATWNDITVNVAVLRPISTNATRVTPSVLSGIISKLSEYHRMVRATAYVLRFVHNLIHHKEKDQHRLNDLSVEEIQSAEIQLIRTVQEEAFAEEIRQLKQGKELLPSSSLKALSPFIDNNSLLRVGGRLRQSDLPYDYKHQILLPSKHRFTHALIISYHRRVSHDGVQSTMAALRQRYWVISTRRTVKSVLKSCHLCFRFSKFRAEQIMGQLPPVRIQSDFPFFNSGIDYAGPFSLLIGTRKSRTYSKAYLALFVCMVTKAVHVEIVSELTTKAFIAALIRFSSRRGIPHALYSDNATTFVGAHNELQELHNFFEAEKTQKDIHNYTSVLNIGWHFIPPRAPSFGGLWENAIKNFKRIFKVVTFNQILNFEDMATFASQIEAILNSRPLVPLSEDPNDLQYLSPGHFLIGRPLTALPFHSPPTTHLDNRCRWKNLQRITQDLWDRWSKEYLVTLQRKNKWLMENDNITVDTMVLLKDINSAPSTWKLARVIETHPGADGKVRVVTIQTSHGKFKRAITSLAPLPFYDDD